MSIIKTKFKFDNQKLLEIYNFISLPENDDVDKNQIYITSFDGKTTMVDSQFKENYKKLPEKELNLLNKQFKNTYLEEVLNEINKHYVTSKWRFMTLTPERRAYSYHYDETKRLHIPLITNEDCFFLVDDELCKMPEKGQLYELDTTKKHTALNLSWKNRVHIVGIFYERICR